MKYSIDMYHVFVNSLIKEPEDIVKEMTPHNADLIHMILGLSGEVGELLDAVKKSVIYQKPLDRENITEELGDIEFYLQGLRNRLLITRDTVISANMCKLQKRYPEANYSDQSAQERKDKL